jgi:hypothetical protein
MTCPKKIPDILPLAAQIPPKSPYLTPEGSHVSSLLGRKAHNGTMKTFIPQGAQWYNENIIFRKAHNVTMKTFYSARRTMLQ